MATLTVGDSFTTTKSHVTGTILEIIEKDNGQTVLLLDTPEGERFTSI